MGDRQVHDVLRVVADPLDVDDNTDEYQTTHQVRATLDSAVRHDFPPDVALILVHHLVFCPDIRVYFVAVVVAQNIHRFPRHLVSGFEHRVGSRPCLSQEVVRSEYGEKFFQHSYRLPITLEQKYRRGRYHEKHDTNIDEWYRTVSHRGSRHPLSEANRNRSDRGYGPDE